MKDAQVVETLESQTRTVPRAIGWRNTLGSVAKRGAALIAIYAVMIAFFATQSPEFLTASNFVLIITSVATLGVVAATQTVVIISGGLDLSVGSTVALTTVVTAKVLSAGGGTEVAILAALALGCLVGLVNAFVITKLRVNPLIATLGMLQLVRGINYVWTDALSIGMPEGAIPYLGRATVFGIPVAVLYMLAVFTIVWFVLRYTVLGRFVYAVGGSPRASFIAGIQVNRVRTIVYVASGASAAVAGLMLSSQLIVGSPQAAVNLELAAVTAAVLGGASLNGGRGRVWLTLVGVLIMGTLPDGLVLMDVSSFWQQAVLGVVLIIAASMDQIKAKRL